MDGPAGKEQEREQQQNQMDLKVLTDAFGRDHAVGEQIPQQQNGLEEHDTGAPDQVRAAVIGQEQFGDDELDLEREMGVSRRIDQDSATNQPLSIGPESG